METIDLKRVNQFTLHKHHLTDSSQISDITKIVSDIGGLHATASTPPYLSLYARHPNFKKDMLTDALYVKRSLAKIRCVRKTVYVQPKGFLPVFYKATQRSSERASRAFMVRQGVAENDYASLVEEVLRAVSEEELTAKELKNKLIADWNISPLLYYMCDQGLLVRAKPPGGWRDRNHKYAPFKNYFPDLDLDQMDEEGATLALVRHYLAAFGPVTMDDVFWWTEFGKTRVRKALDNLGDEVTTLSINGLTGSFYLLRAEFVDMMEMSLDDGPLINLLPYLDPYIMGYKNRERYLNEKDLGMIFDRTGNATSVILVDGVIVGAWDYDEKGGSKIKLFTFKNLPADVVSKIKAKARLLGEFIADEPVELKVCESMTPFSERTVGSFMSPLKGC